ncbi:hypothetical protein ABZ456_30485 [Streptomyces sp. NPDC005776]|uniref:hypothetical protein n=1 Tax=Streptomyces sp. NPDC005776 TaxID=3154676 RepID=UPI00340B398C
MKTAAAQMGYVIFRDTYARDTGTPLEELDERAARAFTRMLAGLAAPPAEQRDPED